MKATGIFISTLLVIDAFLGGYAAGFNSRRIYVIDPDMQPVVQESKPAVEGKKNDQVPAKKIPDKSVKHDQITVPSKKENHKKQGDKTSPAHKTNNAKKSDLKKSDSKAETKKSHDAKIKTQTSSTTKTDKTTAKANPPR